MKEPFGSPGAPPNWSPGSKHGVGTSATGASKVWFTLADGIITELYYPTIDIANTRDVGFLVTDGKTFFDEEKAATSHTVEYTDPDSLAYTITNTALNGHYRIVKRIVTDPDGQSLLMRVRFEPLGGALGLRLFVLFAPHIKNMGNKNRGKVARYSNHGFLVAWREDVAAALTADVPFARASVGYSGSSDAWQDLRDNFEMDWSFRESGEGNLALAAEFDLGGKTEFTLCISFGTSEATAVTGALSSLGRGFARVEKEYIKGWRRYLSGLKDLSGASHDNGRLFRVSSMVLKAHEDKTHGGVIASLSVPWGERRGDGESGGYHLIWPRDLVKAAFAFMAMGETDTPLRFLRFLAATQKPDGSWPQNMWLDGRPYWGGEQLDEVALPVILAWRLKRAGALDEDFYYMARKAASYLVGHGPVTEQDRWEENSGFSPATLAAEISALVCAGAWAEEMGEAREARYLLEIADYWASRIEDWTFSECDCLNTGERGHFLRIVSSPAEALEPGTGVCHVEVFLKNHPSYTYHHQGEMIDAGFLELVRYGLRAPDDAFVTASLRFVDAFLRKDAGYGPLFYRYNGDGYGEKGDGSAFDGTGVGRLWPLLSAERGAYEAMAGADPEPYIRAVEGAVNDGRMIPEQVWDSPDMAERGLRMGRGTGSATPLMWAHAEYINLLATKKGGRGADVIPEVYERYVVKKTTSGLTAWKINKPIRSAPAGKVIRVVSLEPARLVWTPDGWATKKETVLADTGLGVYYADFPVGNFTPGGRLTFTFCYTEEQRWEGRDYSIDMT